MELLAYLLIKHFNIDFPLQTAYMYMNKGKYGHPGGILHAALHGLSTAFVLWVFNPNTSFLLLGLFDAVIHYHVDYFKVRICKDMGWSEYIMEETNSSKHEPVIYKPHLAIYSNNYFHAIGVDQLLHHLTYVAICMVVL